MLLLQFIKEDIEHDNEVMQEARNKAKMKRQALRSDQMAKRDKYDDDSIFSTPENNPALFRSLLGLTENFYKTRNKYAEKYGVEEIRDQLRRTKKGTEERLKLEQKLRKTITKAEKDAADATRTLWSNSYKQATATRKAEMLKQKVASLKNEQEQVKEQLRMSKVVYGKNSAQAKMHFRN